MAEVQQYMYYWLNIQQFFYMKSILFPPILPRELFEMLTVFLAFRGILSWPGTKYWQLTWLTIYSHWFPFTQAHLIFFLLKSHQFSSEELQTHPPNKAYSFMPLSGSPLLAAGKPSHLGDPVFSLGNRKHYFLVKRNTLRWARARSSQWYLWLIHYLLTWMHRSQVIRTWKP